MSTGFSDPGDDFIEFLHDQWQNVTTTPDDEGEFNKFLFEFYRMSKLFGDNDDNDDPLGIHGI